MQRISEDPWQEAQGIGQKQKQKLRPDLKCKLDSCTCKQQSDKFKGARCPSQGCIVARKSGTSKNKLFFVWSIHFHCPTQTRPWNHPCIYLVDNSIDPLCALPQHQNTNHQFSFLFFSRHITLNSVNISSPSRGSQMSVYVFTSKVNERSPETVCQHGQKRKHVARKKNNNTNILDKMLYM